MTRATDSTDPIDPQGATVHEVMQEIAGAGDVFRRFGLDTCCGGELPLATAAEHHDVELDRLLEALDAAAADAAGGAGGSAGTTGDGESDATQRVGDSAGSGPAA